MDEEKKKKPEDETEGKADSPDTEKAEEKKDTIDGTVNYTRIELI
jgi:hypothetical protein